MLVVTIVFVILGVYQVNVYYVNHTKKLWKTRQRILYLSVIYIICKLSLLQYSERLMILGLTICLAVVSILGVYHMTFFIQQLLFLQVLDYLIKKLEKLTMSNFIQM